MSASCSPIPMLVMGQAGTSLPQAPCADEAPALFPAETQSLPANKAQKSGGGWQETGGVLSLPAPSPMEAGNAGTSSGPCCHLLDNRWGGGVGCCHSDKHVSIQHPGQKDPPMHFFASLTPSPPFLRLRKRGQKTFGFYLVKMALPWLPGTGPPPNTAQGAWGLGDAQLLHPPSTLRGDQAGPL